MVFSGDLLVNKNIELNDNIPNTHKIGHYTLNISIFSIIRIDTFSSDGWSNSTYFERQTWRKNKIY